MSWRKFCLNTMLNRLEAVLENNFADIPHDVKFIVGEDNQTKTISCHKLFLAIASPVFEAMFSGRHNISSSKETKELAGQSELDCNANNVLEIRVPDLDPVGLKNVIHYAYSGTFKVDVKDAVATMFASDKYDIPELTEHCSKVLQTDLTLRNVWSIYQGAELLNDEKLKEKAWRFIEGNSGAIMDSDEFLEFSNDDLCNFLKLNYITTGKSELDIFNSAFKWANHQLDKHRLDHTPENIKTLLSDAIPLIRFPVMTAEEFSNFVEPSGVLNANECCYIYKYFSFLGNKRLAFSKTMKYSCRKRVGIFDALFCSIDPKDERCKQIVTRGVGSGDEFSVTGCVNELRLKAIGVVLPSFSYPLGDIEITLALYKCSLSTGRNKIIQTTKKPLSHFSEICFIEFDDPVMMTPNVTYEIKVTELGNEMYRLHGLSGFSEELMKISSVVCNLSNKQRFTVNYTPVDCKIWALRFEIC